MLLYNRKIYHPLFFFSFWTVGKDNEITPGEQTASRTADTTGGVEMCSIMPRRYDVENPGEDCFFRGWVDVQGLGSSNDYCR